MQGRKLGVSGLCVRLTGDGGVVVWRLEVEGLESRYSGKSVEDA